MSRRIDIELTSRTEDGGFTWRAAGAKQPRGVVAASVLPEGMVVGGTVRAEIESGLDGLEVVAVLARSGKVEERTNTRIEVLGTQQRGPDVLVSYAGGARRRRPDGEGPGRRRRPDGEGPDRRRERPARLEDAPRRAPSHRPDAGSQERSERPPRAAGEDRRGPSRRPAPGRAGAARPQAGDEHGRPGVGARRERKAPVSTAYRNAMLATLGPQELPVAEQLLRGGIPAVRQALAEQKAVHAASAAPVNEDAVLAIAEQLLPRVNLANWKDRAASAQATGKELRLRELRAVVTASRTVTLDEDARATAKALRESLDQRVEALRTDWLARMTKALEDGRVADAVRLSARPPEPSTRLPAELAVRLADGASDAMTADSDPQAWLAILESVVESPVRRTVKPKGIPDSGEAKEAARRAAGSVPELAKLLGLPIPPPPPPRRVPGGGGGRRVMAGGGGGSAAGH